MKKSAGKPKAGKVLPKKDTWFKELQGPVLKSLSPACRKIDRAVASLPKVYEEPWAIRIGELIEGSIDKVFNLKSDPDCDAMTLGIIAAQACNSSQMNFRPLLEAKNVTPRFAVRMKKTIKLFTPFQEALGRVSRKITRVMDRQPWETRVAFYNGYARGLEKKMYCGANQCFWENTTTRLYFVLLYLAPWMHQVKSVNQLHGILYPRIGAIAGSDPKRLEKVCQRIGLKFDHAQKTSLPIPQGATNAGA